MNGAPQPRRPPGVVGPAIAALIVLAGLLWLGKWQLDRKAWKEELIATLGQRLTAAPAALPARERWASLDQAADEFRRVQFRAEVVPGEEALVFTSGSAFRPDVSGPGYWAFAPARLAGGGVVVVDRGFVPEGRQDKATRAAGESPEGVDMVGVMRWPETAGWFMPTADPGHNLWFVRDPKAIAQAKNWGEVAPFFIELESPQPPGGLPRPGPLRVELPNDHLQYAMTWFGLAAVLAISFAFWPRSRWREDSAPSES
ncbi:MAG TPA: SURF1 family cytochrome oxidase biogenesis protein [Xanthobacteraceae bacterium]